VSITCCQVEVSVSDWSLVQKSPTDCGVSECDREASKKWGGLGPQGAVEPLEKKCLFNYALRRLDYIQQRIIQDDK
jgi:hypothetical protein